jgi:hypothetical protein
MPAWITSRLHRSLRQVAAVGLIAPALVVAVRAGAGADVSVNAGPSVSAAGVGTAAAKNSPNCGPDGALAYPYPVRSPCTRPLKEGESNGGATTMGVTATTIKVVLVRGSHELQDSFRNNPMNPLPAPIDRATGQPQYLEQAFRDWAAVLAHSFNTWGRKIEFALVA